ncbi:hypothetical protein I7860_22665 [Pseudomonas tolaasii]|uniref:hypothetical protein n=1 Tax=Pseudomonas tolaasii TaxID=29442 RepID=UPI001C59029F|nr:hypothetical protein [Pseudomonas tolaasii]MBW1249479.1 hypothetical protein [Pseudomonas tolaasii]
MTDYTDLQKAAEYAAQDTINFADEAEEMRALQQFHEEVGPETVLELIAEINALKGPHDWLAEDLIKELVDNAQAIQENAEDGEEDQFVIVLLAAAQRIRRQEANIEKLKADVALSAKAADCWDRLNIQNKALSDSFRAERDQLKAESARSTEREILQLAEIEALRQILASSHEFIMNDARTRHMCDEAGQVSQLFPKRVAILASIDTALGKGEQS